MLIKPDDIWLLIVQAFSNHINFNSEELRKMFVNFKGKKTINIYYNMTNIRQIDKSILEDFSVKINQNMKKYLGEELLDTLTPNFSTTNYDTSIICKISIMATFKKYFDYKMELIGICGIPYIILEGTSEDYEKILVKANKLKKYKFEWYIDRITPYIRKMIDAKKGNVNSEFLKNIIKNKVETVFKVTGDVYEVNIKQKLIP